MKIRNNRKVNSDLYELLKDAFPKFNIADIGNRCEVSVPNGTKRVTVSKVGDKYEITGGYNSSHTSFKDACTEILMNLVTRDMMSLGFIDTEINLANKLLIKWPITSSILQ